MPRLTRTVLVHVLVPLLALLTALGTAACSSGSAAPGIQQASVVRGSTEAEAPASAPAPADRSPFWVNPDSEAARQVARWEADGRTADATALRKISERPVALWPTGGGDPGAEVRAAVDAARAGKKTAVFVAYNIPHRDCGAYSAGGAAGIDAYRAWIESFAANLGDRPALVILEPDAVPHIVDGCTPAMYHEARYLLLSDAIDRLKRQKRTKVYLDAGNASRIADTDKLVEPLRRAGVERADGFSLNVAGFQTNQASTAYGLRLSAALDGKHFVVDTGRNGNGPVAGVRGEARCNPPGRALGVAPTEETGDAVVDAYLWIKSPGESDGECEGGPRAGVWWPEYALGLARATA